MLCAINEAAHGLCPQEVVSSESARIAHWHTDTDIGKFTVFSLAVESTGLQPVTCWFDGSGKTLDLSKPHFFISNWGRILSSLRARVWIKRFTSLRTWLLSGNWLMVPPLLPSEVLTFLSCFRSSLKRIETWPPRDDQNIRFLWRPPSSYLCLLWFVSAPPPRFLDCLWLLGSSVNPDWFGLLLGLSSVTWNPFLNHASPCLTASASLTGIQGF